MEKTAIRFSTQVLNLAAEEEWEMRFSPDQLGQIAAMLRNLADVTASLSANFANVSETHPDAFATGQSTARANVANSILGHNKRVLADATAHFLIVARTFDTLPIAPNFREMAQLRILCSRTKAALESVPGATTEFPELATELLAIASSES